jgi:hypothetical protein
VINIFLPGNDSGNVKLWFEAEPSGTSDSVTYTARALHVDAAGVAGRLVFDKAFKIPGLVLADAGGADLRLKTWEDAVEQVKNEERRRAAQALDELREKLRKCAIKADGDSVNGVTADFFGFTGIAAATTTSFQIQINPVGLLPANAAEAALPIFRAEAAAEFKGGFRSPLSAVAVDTVLRLEITLTREGALQLLPQLSVPLLPHLGWRFPSLALPTWSLQGLNLPILDLQLFRIPLQESLDIKTTFDPPPQADFSITNGDLKLTTSQTQVTVSLENTNILKAQDVTLTVDGGGVTVAATHIVATPHTKHFDSIVLSDSFAPLKLTLGSVDVEVAVSAPTTVGPIELKLTLTIDRLLIQSHKDPSLLLCLAVGIELSYRDGALYPVLKRLDVVEPYPIKLALLAARSLEDGARRLLSLIQKIEIPDLQAPAAPGLPSLDALVAVIKRIAALAAAAAVWLAEEGIAATQALAGLAEAVLKMLGELIAELADALRKGSQAIAKAVVVEVRIDTDRWRIAQLVITPADPGVSTEAFTRTLLGFKLDVPYSFSPALVCDFDQGWTAIVLQVTATGKSVKLSTDLWLDNQVTGTTEPVSGSKTQQAEDQPLLSLTVTPSKTSIAIALAGIENGRAFFLKKLVTEASQDNIFNEQGELVVAKGHLLLSAKLSRLESIAGDDFDIKPDFQRERILSLFRSASPTADSGSGQGLANQLSQYIEVKETGAATLALPLLTIPLDIQIHISDTHVDTKVNLGVNLETLSVELKGGLFDIALKDNAFELLKLKGEFRDKATDKAPDLDTASLFLDLRDGDMRLGLKDNRRIDLHYDQLSSSGKGLGFSVDRFIVSRDGIELDAAVKEAEPVTLSGVDMPFRFTDGALSVRRSQIQAFTIAGYGNLPPALVGEAQASIALNFTQQNGGLALQAATAVLDKSADPLRCENTQFSITLSKLGLKYVQQQQDYHFYFTLTGAAEFRPSSNAFANGLLKNLSSLKIVLNEAPLATDPRVLLKHIEFQVTVDPPKRSSFFDLFSFELRGVGFHPSSEAFGGSPALSISGQVKFTDFGDVVSPRFDFHKLWIAPPAQGQALPRIRFDGLGVGLALGSMAEATGTAIAVDGELPTLVTSGLPSKVLGEGVKAKGFLASGSLNIQGWASMSASMGFLELEKAGVAERRQAFFLYLQRNDMSEKIPTPIGTFFLREVGFGFGYRYTLAGIAAADKAETPRELVQLLDEVSKYQGSLDDVRAWLPTFDNAGLTLALRGLFSITSASSANAYNEEDEKELPNLVLFDIVAALRTDLTFLMNVRAWIAYNYADWRKARVDKAPWRDNPTLTGYMYLSAPRREFLARAVYNPGAEIGKHPELPEALKLAMKAVRWSSTLYIRPGLFHMEYGWPYELGFSLGDPSGNFHLVVEGGCVLRFEDAAVLYGLAFRARGFAKFAYDTRGDFGAAITAHAAFALGAKLIAYLSSDVAQSMFYGVIALDVTLEFSVQMWLRSKWFSLSIGFSRSLTIHVGIELLFAPAGIAGRVEASVTVSAFGRSLTLGIGFTLGDAALLNNARARVERFLNLGLGSSYPNPEVGVPVTRPTPLPEPSRADNANRSDQRVQDEADRVAVTAPPAEDKTELPGRPIATVHYWALLFPVPASGDTPRYLVQLIPRDASPSEDMADMLTATHFYAATLAGSTHAEYRVTGLMAGEILSLVPPVADDSGALQIRTNWGTHLGRLGSGKDAREHPPSLQEAFDDGCFLTGQTISASDTAAEKILAWTDIDNIPWDEDVFFLPEDPEAASLVLKSAARSRAQCGTKWKRVLQIEEARSCIIATLAESAQRLASLISFDGNGQLVLAGTEALELDPRALGLSFVLTQGRVKELFERPESDTGAPIKSTKLMVRTRLPVVGATAEYAPASRVALFNPPERMFHEGSPVLKDLKGERRATGVLLFWDLEWRFRSSTTLYADPEFHLKHYRIERRIEALASGVAPAPRIFEAKKADLIELCLLRSQDGKLVLDAQQQPQLRKRRHRSHLQFADDLQEVPANLRAQLLTPVTADDRRLAENSLLTKDTRIVYTVLPVDGVGTFGVPPPPITIDIAKAKVPQKSVLKAIARFHYDTVPKLGSPFVPEPSKFLALTLEEEALPVSDDDEAPKLSPVGAMQLRIRGERTVAVGVFGADALSQARNEPPVPARSERDPGAGDKDIVLSPAPGEALSIQVTRVPRRLTTRTTPGPTLEGSPKTDTYSIKKTDWEDLLEALDIESTERVRAARLYIRPLPNGKDTELHPEWIPIQLQLQIGRPKKEPAVDVTIERFEHPLDVQFQALSSARITPSSGRLHLYHPSADASFDAFVKDAQDAAGAQPRTVVLWRDGERRTAVRLAWEARPQDLGLVGEKEVPADADMAGRHSLIGGYDLFALDATAIPKDAHERPGWPERFIRPLGRVQRLPTAQRGLDPSETGDFGRVEVLYPSETRRLLKAPSGMRRANWFSPAETCLLWPKRVLRRSVLTLPDNTDIAALFARGRPSSLRVAWAADTPVSAGFARMVDGTKVAQPDGVFKPLKPGSFSVEEARQLLLSLVLDGTLSELDADADKQPNTFSGLKLVLTAIDATPLELCQVVVNLALAPSLHPILADVLDLVQYAWSTPNYRRYEPVLDTAPAVNATELGMFLDDTVAERDPSGWGVLRTLGLAAGLRLYDVEAGEFLTATDALVLLNDALQRVLPRYADAPQALGAPFVDVMFTNDGLADTASFHGTAGVAADTAYRLVNQHALALVQIELRPTPLPYVVNYEPEHDKRHRPQVIYATLHRQRDHDGKLPAAALLLLATQPRVLLEIEPRVRSAGQPTHRVLLMKGRDGQRFPEGSADTIAGALRLEPQADEKVLAYLRIVSFDPKIKLDGDLNTLVQIEKIGADSPSPELLAASVEPTEPTEPTDDPGPWGRFTDLPDFWLAALLFGDGSDNTTEAVLSETPFRNTLNTLTGILGRMTGKKALGDLPQEATARLQLAAKLGPWTRRFLERGAARPLKTATPTERVGVAFAMLTRPQPWRLAPSSDGQLAVTLFEKDRFGKLRKYAVRPFGRYESLARAVQIHEMAAEAKANRTLAPALPPPGLDQGALPLADPLRSHFADVSIERTEPLAAPVIVAARRLDESGDGVTRPGRTVEIIVSRHPEEALADANIPVDAGIAMRHVAVGFWREFSSPKWASAVQKSCYPAGSPAIRLLEPFGPFKNASLDYARLKPPKALTLLTPPKKGAVPVYTLHTEQPRRWYEAHPDLWLGAYVLTLADLPYGFRLHATAHAAAGVVVSPTSAATVGEMGYRLALPWQEGLEGDAGPWQDRKVPVPSWQLTGDDQQRAVRIRWPLVRFVDGLFEDVRKFWLGDEAAPEVYGLPDPAVSYRLSITANDDRIRVGEAEFSAIADAGRVRRAGPRPSGDASGLYLAQAIGPRFEQPRIARLQRLPAAGTPTHYELSVDLSLRPGDAQAPPPPQAQPVFALSAQITVPAPQGLQLPPDRMVDWGRIAPSPSQGTLSLVITPPAAQDQTLPINLPGPPHPLWTAFKARIGQYLQTLQTYANGPGPQRVKDAAAAIATEVARFAVDRVAHWPGPRSGDGKTALAATPALPWLLGLPIQAPEVNAQAPEWAWPPQPGRDAGRAAFRTQIATALQPSPTLQAAVEQALLAYAAAWLAHGIASRRHTDDTPWNGLAPLRRAAPGGLMATDWTVIPAGPFDYVASLTLPPAPGREKAAIEAAFEALEGEAHTAETLEGLLLLWFDPARSIQLQLRGFGLPAISPVLTPLAGGTPIAPSISAVILRLPALTTETASTPGQLPAQLDDMTVEMLFGPGKRLLIQAFHGLAKPQEDHIERGHP